MSLTALLTSALSREATKVFTFHNLYEVLKGLGLDSPDLSLADTPQVEVTQSFVRALGRPRDLRVVRDDPVPARS